jgi:hypothetical protein
MLLSIHTDVQGCKKTAFFYSRWVTMGRTTVSVCILSMYCVQ